MKNFERLKKAYYLSAVVIGGLCLLFIYLYGHNIGFNFSNTPQNWANFGSYIGGVVGPLISLLAFVGILLTVTNQNEESHKIERENRKQSTENRIIKHLEFHHKICDNVKIQYEIKTLRVKEGRQAFEFLFEKTLKTFYEEVESSNPHLDEEQKIDHAFSKLYKKHGRQFGFYFRNLFYLIKYIDESENIDQNHYARLIRAQLSTPEIQMLMYNCLFKKGKGFKVLVEKYGLLNGIDTTEMIKKEHKILFDGKAFV